MDDTQVTEIPIAEIAPTTSGDARRFILEIAHGWTIDQIKTEDDCDRAFIFLSSSITSIEYQLELDVVDPSKRAEDKTWPARARAALRLKKAAVQAVQNARNRIRREESAQRASSYDRAILRLLKAERPDILADLALRAAEETGK